MSLKKLVMSAFVLCLIGFIALALIISYYSKDLPKMITLKDYKPLLVSEVYDRNQKKIGEYVLERRKITPITEIPELVKHAFISAEDSSFYEHSGINLVAIGRAMLANIKAGRKVQGGSTITQQVAKTIVLQDNKKKYSRKIKEAILAYKMEQSLKKEEIMYLYLNQIYFGHGAYGIAMASEIYFRKPIKDITLKEAALLAGLPQAPSRYTPVHKPKAAKKRQIYVLNRMAQEKYITEEQAKEAIDSDLEVYTQVNYKKKAPYFLETLRQILIKHVGYKPLHSDGLQIYTGLDIDKQNAAQLKVRQGIEELDKRQGFRGAIKNETDPTKVSEFLLKTRDKLVSENSPLKVIKPDGSITVKTKLNLTGLDSEGNKLPNLPKYLKPGEFVEAIVTQVSDKYGVTTVRFGEHKGMIDVKTMEWARKPNSKVSKKWARPVKKASTVLTTGDIILVQIKNEVFKPTRLAATIRNASNGKTCFEPGSSSIKI